MYALLNISTATNTGNGTVMNGVVKKTHTSIKLSNNLLY